MNWYTGAFKKYVDFSGRAHRTEYWMFTLINLVVTAVLGLGGLAIGGKGTGIALYVLYSLASFLPGLAVLVRRLHDTSRSGFWALIALVPYVGVIVVIVFACIDGTPGPNQYGPNPKNPDAQAPADPPWPSHQF